MSGRSATPVGGGSVGRTTRLVGRSTITGLLTIVAVFAIYPLFFMLATSLKSQADYIRDPLSLPATVTYVENFAAMFARFDIVRLYANSVSYIALAWVICVVAAVPAAFAFAKLEFPGRRLLFMAFISSLAIPGVTFIIPDYVLFARLGLIDHPASVILLWATTALPGSLFLLSAFMRSLPRELLEAARVDGAGYFQIMRRIVIPMSVPGIVTITIFAVTAWWNDLLTPLVFLQSEEKATVTLGVATTVQRFGGDTPLLVTGLLMAAIPPVLTYIIAQRSIRRGLVLGALN
ncbi:carbohydrate ABC transporter permease [Actinopolymorpha sp. B17G11]|uniref:carbohydrate ABC transporter permease n=1 Tax=unclassified Actinopolymorpha TaxID=2627063 RepID=UPI0032D90ECE